MGPSPPERTCIGCRRRAVTAELFRVVATPGPAGATSDVVLVVPDPRRRMPGRGAWLHPDPDCVAQATRRRAFGRALRVPAPVDVSAVAEHVSGAPRDDTGVPTEQDTTSGSTAGDDEQ
ncbi:YlxR family protein [Jatrophihabitans endophyticus]|uniref:YlxR family protein n=1 Tax=Jatrophihabitans endophyticus TaxID=1206085 RepID=UPI0026EE1ACF|nr:YlxR family protein [Jatrophihabitans endophyticus]